MCRRKTEYSGEVLVPSPWKYATEIVTVPWRFLTSGRLLGMVSLEKYGTIPLLI